MLVSIIRTVHVAAFFATVKTDPVRYGVVSATPRLLKTLGVLIAIRACIERDVPHPSPSRKFEIRLVVVR